MIQNEALIYGILQFVLLYFHVNYRNLIGLNAVDDPLYNSQR